MRRRKHHRLFEVLQRLACYGINNGDALDRVTKHLKTCNRFVISWMHFDGVTAHAEVASTKSQIVSVILQIDETLQDAPLVVVDTHMQLEQIATVFVWISHAVNATD